MRPGVIGRSVLPLALATFASAQQFPLQLLVTQSGRSLEVQNAGAVPFISHVGQPQIAHVNVTYTGTGTAVIVEAPVLVGSLAFTTNFKATLPVTLTTGKSYSFDIQFLPTGPAQAVGQLNERFTETVTDAQGNPTTTQNNLRLSLSGTAPQFVISYALQTDPNTVPLPPGGSIVFPPTLAGTTTQAALNFTNTGTGLGTITDISVTGDAFRLTGKPLLPDGVGANQNLQVQILYKPSGGATDTGHVTVTFDVDGTVTIPLQGSSSSSAFVYQILQVDAQTPLAPGGTVTFPPTKTGQISSVVIRVLNSGNAAGTVSLVNLIGTGFQLSPAPVLPQTLQPNGAATYTVTFAPSQPGPATGTLLINSDNFSLSGIGLGPQLTLSYAAAGSTITINSTNTSVVFSPVTVSQSAQITFDVKNTGTLAAILSNIGVAQASSPFSVSGIPSLPVSLAPNADLQFTISFTPVALGFTTGSLQLDATLVPLIGSGMPPPPLPAYSIAGASGTVLPLAQPSLSLSLANPYPVAVSGTLTLSSSGNLPADPAVQFASGGLTVPFVIPANGTSATFGNSGAKIGLQTGTVANTITITPSFATRAGGVDLTPAPPATAQFTVAPAAPTLLSVLASSTAPAATGQTATLTLTVTGFATTRTLTSWTVQFTPVQGVDMPVSKFTADIQQLAAAWFRSTASQPFGGQFTVTLPFTFNGLPTGGTLAGCIASVSVILNNEVGASNSVQTPVQ